MNWQGQAKGMGTQAQALDMNLQAHTIGMIPMAQAVGMNSQACKRNHFKARVKGMRGIHTESTGTDKSLQITQAQALVQDTDSYAQAGAM